MLIIKRYNWFFVMLVLCLSNACYNEKRIVSSIHEKIDVSPNDSSIAYSYCDSAGCSIQEITVASGKTVKLTPADNFNYICPRYSSDGSKILFLTNTSEKGNQQRISVYNRQSNKITHVSTIPLYVTEAAFSIDGSGYYFIGVTLYKYASLRSGPSFSYDIYFIDTLGNNLRRITELSARIITGIAIFNSENHLITRIETLDKQYYGFFQISLKNGEIESFQAKSEDGAPASLIFKSEPSVSSDGKELIVASARVLTAIDMQTRQAKVLYSAGSTFVYSPRHFHSNKKVAFTKDSLQAVEGQRPVTVSRKIYILDIETRAITECPLPIQ